MPFSFQFSPAEDYVASENLRAEEMRSQLKAQADAEKGKLTRDYVPKAGSIASYVLSDIPSRLTSATAYAMEGNARAANDMLAEVENFKTANREALEKMARYNGTDQTKLRVAQTSMSLLDGSYMNGTPKQDGSPDEKSLSFLLSDKQKIDEYNYRQSQLGTANADVNALLNDQDAREMASLLNEDLYRNAEVSRNKRAGMQVNGAAGMTNDQLIMSAKTLHDMKNALGDQAASAAWRAIRGNCRTADDVKNYTTAIQTLVGEDASVENVYRASSRLNSLFNTYMANRGNLAKSYSTGASNPPDLEQYAAFSSAVDATVSLAKRIGITDGDTIFSMVDHIARSGLVDDIERADKNGLLSIVNSDDRRREMEIYYAKQLSTVYPDLSVSADLLNAPSKIEIYNNARSSLSSKFIGPTPQAAMQIDPKTGKAIEVVNAADAMMSDNEAMGRNMLGTMFSSLDQVLAPSIASGNYTSTEEAMKNLLGDDAFRSRAADLFQAELSKNGMFVNDDNARMMVQQAFDLAGASEDGTIDFEQWTKAVTTVSPDVKDAEYANAIKRSQEINQHRAVEKFYRPGEEQELAGYQILFMGLDPKQMVDVDGAQMSLADVQMGITRDTLETAAFFFPPGNRELAVTNFTKTLTDFMANEVNAKTKKDADGNEIENETAGLTEDQKYTFAVNNMTNNKNYTSSIVVYDTGKKDQDGKNIQLTLGDVISFADRSPEMKQALLYSISRIALPQGMLSDEEVAEAKNVFNSVVESTVRNCMTVTSGSELDVNRSAYVKSLARDFAYADAKVMANLNDEQRKEYEDLKKQVSTYMARYYETAKSMLGKKPGEVDPRYDVKVGLGMYADNASIGRAFSDTMSIMSSFEDGAAIVGRIQELMAESVAGPEAAKYVRDMVKTESIARQSKFTQLAERLKRNEAAIGSAKTRRWTNTVADGVMDAAGIITGGIGAYAKTGGSTLMKWAVRPIAMAATATPTAPTALNYRNMTNAIDTWSPAFDSGIGDGITLPQQFDARPKSGDLWGRYIGAAVSGAIAGGAIAGFSTAGIGTGAGALIGAGVGVVEVAATELIASLRNNRIDKAEYSNISYAAKDLFAQLRDAQSLSPQAKERVQLRIEEAQKKADELYDNAWFYVNTDEQKQIAEVWTSALNEAVRELKSTMYYESSQLRDSIMQKLRAQGTDDANRMARFSQEASGFYVGVSPNGACKDLKQASANMRAFYNFNANRLSAKNAAMANQVASQVISSIPGLTNQDATVAQNLAARALADYDQAVMSGKTTDLPSDKNGYVISRVYNDLYRMAQQRQQYNQQVYENKIAARQSLNPANANDPDEDFKQWQRRKDYEAKLQKERDDRRAEQRGQ